MHLSCDAFNETAVLKLRNLKKRDGKPFALMFRDIESLRPYAETDITEEQSIQSWRRPIVLLRKKKVIGLPLLAESISSELNLIGAMLPYMPFHYLLFRKLKTNAIVLTSGNFSNEPILTDNISALSIFSKCTDAIILHNRDIFNRTDDSVVRVTAGKERILRRSRGYVPAPVYTALNTDGILALAPSLQTVFAQAKGRMHF